MENNRIAVARAMKEAGITQWGVARYADVLPLLPVRAASRLPKNPRSVIVALLGYYTGEKEHNISRYAWPRDYHLLAQQLMEPVAEQLRKAFPEQTFAVFTDNSPIREVTAARLAGLGFVGKNGLLINRRYGSYHFITEIVTDLALTPDSPEEKSCGDCRRCLDACPLGALSPEGVTLSRCRSHITQKKGELQPWERKEIEKGALAWGCDICSDVCPYNQKAALTDIPAFLQAVESQITRENLPGLLKEKAFGWRGIAVMRRNLDIIEPPCSNGEETGE